MIAAGAGIEKPGYGFFDVEPGVKLTRPDGGTNRNRKQNNVRSFFNIQVPTSWSTPSRTV